MGLTLKYVVRTKADTLHYRRRLPKDVAASVGKAEFKRLLGQNEREALKSYPQVHASFERLVADVRRKLAARDSSPNATALDVHRAAELMARQMQTEVVHVGGRELTADDPDAAAILRDRYIESLPVDPETGDPIGGDPVLGRALGMLVSSRGLSRPIPTLEDAKRRYADEKISGTINETRKLNRLNLVMTHLKACGVDASRELTSLTRDDARDLRDYMLRDLDLDPASAKRYLNVISAVVGFAFEEFEISNVRNPFQSLTVKGQTRARDQRHPIPDNTLKAIRARLETSARSDLWQIWRIVEGTGCRLGEVTGLLVSDLHLEEETPYFSLVHHPHRSLKNDASMRWVPLVGEALVAAKEAVKAADGPFLFPRYGRERGADAASAILMKHIRAVTDDTKIGNHSLRHTMKDRLIRARVNDTEQNLLLGHLVGGEGRRYGSDYARLEAVAGALKAALGIKD
jgi:integrase